MLFVMFIGIKYVICVKKKKKIDNSYYEYTYTDIQALSNSC